MYTSIICVVCTVTYERRCSSSRQIQWMKEHHGDSNEGKTKWKEGKGKNTSTSTHKCKYHSNRCNDCNIDGHTEENHWNLHLDLNSNCKKDRKKNNPLSIDLSNLVESRSNVDENIFLKYMQKEVNINILHHQ
jgi:hypothetical protein